MTARRVTALTLELPMESRTMQRAYATEVKVDLWSRDQTLLGMLIERIDQLHATTIKASGGKVRGKAPEIVPRPKIKKAVKPQSTTEIISDLSAMMAAAGGDG